MVQVLTAYCLVSTGVKLQCYHINDKGKKSMVLNTNSNSSVRDNITNVFGPKQIESLREFVQSEPSQETCDELNTKCPEASSLPFQVRGHVSTIEHGKGRSCADRQFLFVNNRPCEMTKLTRTVNEVYHQYNRHQYPFVMLNVQIHKESVDVNVTPDKRQIFMENEKLLLAIVKTSLIKMYEPLASSYQLQIHSKSSIGDGDSLMSVTSQKLVSPQTHSSVTSSVTKLKRTFTSAFAIVSEPPTNKAGRHINMTTRESSQSHFPRLDAFIQASKRPRVESAENTESEDDREATFRRRLSGASRSEKLILHEEVDLTDGVSHDVVRTTQTEKEPRTPTSDMRTEFRQDGEPRDEPTSTSTVVMHECGSAGRSSHDSQGGSDKTSEDGDSKLLISDNVSEDFESPEFKSRLEFTAHESDSLNQDLISRDRCHGEEEENDHHGDDGKTADAIRVRTEDCLILVDDKANYDEPVPISRKRSVHVKFSLDKLRERCQKRHSDNEERRGRRFRAAITPGDNRQAEDELRKQVDKQMLSEMEVLGQFNLGFIIARLQNDLFIVDQHATDEKYNFETLQRTTTLNGQTLITPQDLQLSVVNESLLMENLHVFRKNGFDFLIDEEAPCRQKVKLISAPVSRNWLFGKNDIDEMLFMLGESPGLMCRPSRVREMFASRACRKSIMIGTALSYKEMKKLLRHMSEIDQPWNCPHGRPTMRHLINLDMIAG